MINDIKKRIRQLPVFQILSKDKLVNSKFLNQKGIQKWRMAKAIERYKDRKFEVSPLIKDQAHDIYNKGITQIDNFLDKDHFAQVAAECRAIRDIGHWQNEKKMGPNVIKNLALKGLDLSPYPGLKKLIEDERIKRMFEAAEKRPIDIYGDNFYVLLQYLVQGDEDAHDPESDLHVDTFFNTHKAWLYIDDVKLENGPFVFVEESHKVDTPYRIEKEYEYSKRKNVKGSRRIPQSELDEQNMKERICTCNKNTLVLANTLGYHRRLNGKGGHDRLTVAFSARFNPFF